MMTLRHDGIAAATAALVIAAPLAAEEKQVTSTTEKKVDDEVQLPPMSADKTVKQSATIGGRTITYDATVGTIPSPRREGQGDRPVSSTPPMSFPAVR